MLHCCTRVFPLKVATTRVLRYCTSAAIIRFPEQIFHVLQLAVEYPSLLIARQSHTQVFSQGLQHDTFFAVKLIAAYSSCKALCDARSVFDSLPLKNLFVYNCLLSGYSRNHSVEEALALFGQMCREGISDNYTFATVSKICSEICDLRAGRTVHCLTIKTGYGSDTVLLNSVIAMYCKCHSVRDARNLFGEMTQRNVGSWNVLISEYANAGELRSEDVYKIVKQMQKEELQPDAFTVATLVPLCTREPATYGRELHCYTIRIGLTCVSGSDLHLGSSLIDMYAKGQRIIMARHVFDLLMHKNIVCWTAMIAGYVQNSDIEEALMLFRTMQIRYSIVPNRVSLVAVLPACSSLASLVHGRQIHGFAIRSHLNYDVSLKNALIDMYSKCGSLKCARNIFDDDSCTKDVISWSSIISGYGLYGKPEEALLLFDEMCQLGFSPDHITSVGILSACARSGLANKGLEIYNLLTSNFGIVPTVEICSCMVDLFGRAGQLELALCFINAMSVKHSPSIWGALLNASVLQRDLKMQELAYHSLSELDPENPSNYVSFSNLQAFSGRWDAVADLRTQMKARGLRKHPGYSWIALDDKVHSFFVSDKSHPSSDRIYETVENLVLVMKGVYAPNFEYLP